MFTAVAAFEEKLKTDAQKRDLNNLPWLNKYLYGVETVAEPEMRDLKTPSHHYCSA
jgi:hypothetical protein